MCQAWVVRSLRWCLGGLVVSLMSAGCVRSDPDDASMIALSDSRASGEGNSVSMTEPAGSSCQPTVTEQEPLIGVEAQALSTNDAEGWALVFLNLPGSPGDPLVIPATDEPVKIVWRLTGDGDVAFNAIDPNGEPHELAWGPDAHGGSNWLRPGDEWGTGWLLDIPGCWTLEATRGDDSHSVTALVSA